MSEWSIEHAWKLIPLARADAHRNPPTHSRSTTSRNNDLLQRVPVNDGVAPGFRGVCDTVLTQFADSLTPYISMFFRTHRWSGQQLGFPSASTENRFKTFDERHVFGARHIEERVPAQRPVGRLNAWRTREASSLANASVTGACPMIRRKYSGPVNASMSRSASVSGGSSPAAMA